MIVAMACVPEDCGWEWWDGRVCVGFQQSSLLAFWHAVVCGLVEGDKFFCFVIHSICLYVTKMDPGHSIPCTLLPFHRLSFRRLAAFRGETSGGWGVYTSIRAYDRGQRKGWH